MSVGKIPLISEQVFEEKMDELIEKIPSNNQDKLKFGEGLEYDENTNTISATTLKEKAQDLENNKQNKLKFGEGLEYDEDTNTLSVELDGSSEEMHHGSGGAPAKHTHPVEDIYLANTVGGTWNSNFAKVAPDLVNAISLNPEFVDYITTDRGITVEEFASRYGLELHGNEPVTDSSGGNWYIMTAYFNNRIIKEKVAPQSSLYDMQYGNVVKILGEMEEPDLEKIVLTSSEKNIHFTLGETPVENGIITDKLELFNLLAGGGLEPQTPEDVDAIVEKYGNKAITVTLQCANEDGTPLNVDSMSFADYFDSELLNMFTTQMILIVSEETIAPIIESEDDEEVMSQFKFQFDEVETETTYKTPLLEKLAENVIAINELKTSDVDMERVVKKTTEWYGGDKTEDLGWLFNYNYSQYENGKIYDGTSIHSIHDKMTSGHSYQLQRIKMGSVFEFSEYEDEETKELIPNYAYIGTASELDGLSYQVYTDWNKSEQRSEKFVSSLDDYLNESGHFELTQEHIDTLNELEVMFITIIDSNGNGDIYGISKKAPDGDGTIIHIDEVVPYQKYESTEWLSNIISNVQATARGAQNTADNAQDTANFAQNTANNAQETANNAQSTAEQAQSTAEQAQSIAESAQNTANNAQSRAESAENTANSAQGTAENAQSILAERYTNAEINNLVSSIPKFSIKVVNVLPVSDISTTTVYLLAKQNPESSNMYTEYIYVNNSWEKLGEQVLDLSDYYTQSQTDTAIQTAISPVSTAVGNAQSKADSAYTLAQAAQTAQQVQVAITNALNSYSTTSNINTMISTAIANFLTESQIRTIVQEMINTATNKMVESDTVTNIEKMTESEYAALETKSETTMYAVVEDEVVGNA